jgi:hypothetical protein
VFEAAGDEGFPDQVAPAPPVVGVRALDPLDRHVAFQFFIPGDEQISLPSAVETPEESKPLADGVGVTHIQVEAWLGEERAVGSGELLEDLFTIDARFDVLLDLGAFRRGKRAVEKFPQPMSFGTGLHG